MTIFHHNFKRPEGEWLSAVVLERGLDDKLIDTGRRVSIRPDEPIKSVIRAVAKELGTKPGKVVLDIFDK